MSDKQWNEPLRKRLDIHRSRLAELQLQQAIFGITADPRYQIEIDKIRKDIQSIEQKLLHSVKPVEDHSDDMESERVIGMPSPPARARGVTPPGNRIPASLRDPQIDRIIALRELIEHRPEMRDVVVSCLGAFRNANNHLHKLRGYKSLHDHLHNIQLRCYRPIRTVARHLAGTGDSDDQIDDYVSELEEYVDKLWKAVETYIFLKEITGWLPKFAKTCSDIRTAIAHPDAEQLEKALNEIESILRIYPSQIHWKLSEAARMMDLDALIRSMSDICDMLFDLRPVDDIARGFASDVKQLQELKVLVDDHGRWQEIDTLLERLEHNQNQNDIEILWDLLKIQAEPLCAGNSDSWAQFLRDRATLLEQAIRDGDAHNVAVHLQSYRARASRQFYEVDDRLHKLCQNLDGSNSALAVIRGVLT